MSEKKIEKTVTESAPSISRVLLIDGGRGGLKVKYNIGQTINGMLNSKKRSEEVTRPVQSEIRNGFKALKIHLLRACGYHWSNNTVKEMLLAKCVVTSVSVDKKDRVQVGGYMLMYGTHHAAIASPFLTSDDYDEFSDLNDIVDGVCEESKLFMNGTKSADAKVIVIDYLTIKKDVANADDAYSKMSDAEIEEITREALLDSGLVMVEENGEMVIALAKDSMVSPDSLMVEQADEEIPEAPFEADAIEPVAEAGEDEEFMEL